MPAAKKPATKKPAAKEPAAKKPVAKKPAARVVPSVSPHRGKTIAWYVSTLSAAQQGVAQRLVDLIEKTVPAAKGSIKWAQPVWELEGPFVWVKGSKGHLSIGFWRGADLDDAAGVLEGAGDRMRHVKLRDGAEPPWKALAPLLRQAAALNARDGNPMRRGGA